MILDPTSTGVSNRSRTYVIVQPYSLSRFSFEREGKGHLAVALACGPGMLPRGTRKALYSHTTACPGIAE